MKTVLWVNPSFLDYRIPLYSELYRKTKGAFHLLYSKNRIPSRCHDRVREGLGKNAHYIEKERILRIGKSDSGFANGSIAVPWPSGLYAKIKSIRPDILIAEGFFQFTPWAVVYSMIHRVPLFICYERTAHTERNCPVWRKLYRKFINLFVSGYVVNGRLTKEYLISQGVKADGIFEGAMCADSAELAKAYLSMSEKAKSDFEQSIEVGASKGLRYIYVGRMIECKGVKYLLDAWIKHSKEHPNDELLLVGDGALLADYKRDYDEISSIKFMGGVDYSQIYKFYSISDVFVIPTLEDNWSLVVPEAMACGLPIACSIYNGCHPELVKEGHNGITFDPLKQESILDALRYFHSKDLKEMSIESRNIEHNYNPDKVSDNILKALPL